VRGLSLDDREIERAIRMERRVRGGDEAGEGEVFHEWNQPRDNAKDTKKKKCIGSCSWRPLRSYAANLQAGD
jgi:hypothetical protein